MSVLVIEPHYLGSLEYYALLLQYDRICFEIKDSFPKQTFRNRTYLLASNKVQPLIIPVRYSHGTITEDVMIDYSQRWIKDHWGALYSAYGKAPFFEYFGEEIKSIWDERIPDLVALNCRLFQLTLQILQVDIDVSFTTEFGNSYDVDFRNLINPKIHFSDRKIYNVHSYPQLFGDTFVPNLSIIDLIMNEGPNAAHILMKSFTDTKKS